MTAKPEYSGISSFCYPNHSWLRLQIWQTAVWTLSSDQAAIWNLLASSTYPCQSDIWSFYFHSWILPYWSQSLFLIAFVCNWNYIFLWKCEYLKPKTHFNLNICIYIKTRTFCWESKSRWLTPLLTHLWTVEVDCRSGCFWVSLLSLCLIFLHPKFTYHMKFICSLLTFLILFLSIKMDGAANTSICWWYCP